MATPKAKAPSLRYHISGQSVVTIDGKDYYLGKHDSPETIARYAVLIKTYQDGGLKLASDFDPADLDVRAAILLDQMAPQPTQQAAEPLLVRHITASYRGLIKTKYASNPAELHRLNQICDETDKHEGDLRTEEYGPLALQRQRQRWIDGGNSRVYCNRLTNAVVRMFKYAVSQELVSNETWQKLKSVEPLRLGQTVAPETEPIKPVAIEVVRETAKHLSPVLGLLDQCAPNISSVVKIAVSQNVAQAEAEGWLVDENASGNFELSKGLSRCVIRSVPDRINLPRDKLAARKAG